MDNLLKNFPSQHIWGMSVLSCYLFFQGWGTTRMLDSWLRCCQQELVHFGRVKTRNSQFSFFRIKIDKDPYGYVWKWGPNPQWNSHLVGIMISKTIGFRGTLFSDKDPYLPAFPGEQKARWTDRHMWCLAPWQVFVALLGWAKKSSAMMFISIIQ